MTIIVTRHPATLEWLLDRLDLRIIIDCETGEPWERDGMGCAARIGSDDLPIDDAYVAIYRGDVGPDQVRGHEVVGNLPLHLAALAESVWAVEFTGPPPRGQEYTAEDMDAAGACLRQYRVTRC